MKASVAKTLGGGAEGEVGLAGEAGARTRPDRASLTRAIRYRLWRDGARKTESSNQRPAVALLLFTRTDPNAPDST